MLAIYCFEQEKVVLELTKKCQLKLQAVLWEWRKQDGWWLLKEDGWWLLLSRRVAAIVKESSCLTWKRNNSQIFAILSCPKCVRKVNLEAINMASFVHCKSSQNRALKYVKYWGSIWLPNMSIILYKEYCYFYGIMYPK